MLPQAKIIEQIEVEFKKLETILLCVADRYSNTIVAIDEILDKANT